VQKTTIQIGCPSVSICFGICALMITGCCIFIATISVLMNMAFLSMGDSTVELLVQKGIVSRGDEGEVLGSLQSLAGSGSYFTVLGSCSAFMVITVGVTSFLLGSRSVQKRSNGSVVKSNGIEVVSE
jgi:hypothetical protein